MPSGRVVTYGQVATWLGSPRAARAVGYAMFNTPESLDGDVPWHRVLNVRGEVSIPRTSSSHDEQIRRLAEESVPMMGGRVNMSEFRWQPDLDELMWGPIGFDLPPPPDGIADE